MDVPDEIAQLCARFAQNVTGDRVRPSVRANLACTLATVREYVLPTEAQIDRMTRADGCTLLAEVRKGESPINVNAS